MSTQVDLFTNGEPTSVSPAIAKLPVSRSTFYQGDCLVEMSKIADKSVDMILCDLPYGTTECSWDAVIPYEMLWSNYRRIAEDNAAIILTATEPFASNLRLSNIGMYKYDWIWDKKRTTGFGNANRQPLRQHEVVCVFYKKQPVYNPIPYPKNVTKSFNGKRTLQKSEVYGRTGINNDLMTDSKEGYPRSIITQIPVMNNLTSDKIGLHPTQKPVALMEYLIKTYTNEGDTVLDNCMGSGTTGVACKKTGRNFIGIEKDPKYFEIAVSRVSAYCG